VSSRAKIETIQVLRGIGALGVLLWHVSFFTGAYGTGLAGALFHPGSIMGVDMFFLICGFVIFTSATKGDADKLQTQPALDFLVRRMVRIYPLYFACTLILFSIEYGADRQTIPLLLRSLLFLPTDNTALPNIFQPTMTVGWSITYEIIFYATFAAALCFRTNVLQALCFWAIAVILSPAILEGNIWLDPTFIAQRPSAFLAIAANPLNLLFVVGVMIGVIYRSPLKFPSRRAARWAILCASAICIAQYAFHWNISHGMKGVGLPLAALLLVLVIAEKTERFEMPRALVFLGDISYSIYLIHPITIWMAIGINVYFNLGNPLQGWFLVVLTTVATIPMAAISYALIEQKLGRRLSRIAQDANLRLQMAILPAFSRFRLSKAR